MKNKNEKNMLKKRNLPNKNSNSGFILIMGIIALTSLLLLALPFLAQVVSERKLSEKSYKTIAALSLAEAGVERAIWELNKGDISTWDGDSTLRTKSITSFQASGGTVIGDIDISVQNPEEDYPVIESTGRVNFTDSFTINKTVRAVLEREGGLLFGYGVFAHSSVKVESNATVNGNIGTNGTASSAIRVENNSIVNGDLICGPGGDPETAINVHPGSTVTGTQEAASEIVEFPTVNLPVGLPYQGSYSSTGPETISTSGEYSSFSINRDDITISGDVIILVTDSFSVSSNSSIQVQEGGSLTIYLSGSVSFGSHCDMNSTLQDASKFRIYATADVTDTVEFDSNQTIYAAVYMPGAEIKLESNAGIYGAFYANKIRLHSNIQVSYDTNLDGFKGAPGYDETSTLIVRSWREKNN